MRATASCLACATAAFLAILAPAARAATPCEAPERFVRGATLDVAVGARAAPLVHPYVIGGIAAVALREDGGERWLELAVHSADDARRQLTGRAAGERREPVLATWADRVWLRCPPVLSARG